MTDQPQAAYEPDSTPNVLGAEVGMDHKPASHPITPTPVGETLLDPESGETYHIEPRDDGRPVPLQIGANEGTDRPQSVDKSGDKPKEETQ